MNSVVTPEKSPHAHPIDTTRFFKQEELFTLYRTDKPSEGFYVSSVPSAILKAKRILDIAATASVAEFRAAGGDYILRNSTGNRIYPEVRH